MIEKVCNVIDSCKTEAQIRVAEKYVRLYIKSEIDKLKARWSDEEARSIIRPVRAQLGFYLSSREILLQNDGSAKKDINHR